MDQHDIDNAQDCLWYGIFLNEDMEGELANQIDHQHVTFGFKVTPPEGIDWNAEFPITLTGYGNDGINEGYSCEFPEELDFAYDASPTPHVTVSVSDDGKPVDTRDLDFDPIDPIVVYGKFGYFRRGEFVI